MKTKEFIYLTFLKKNNKNQMQNIDFEELDLEGNFIFDLKFPMMEEPSQHEIQYTYTIEEKSYHEGDEYSEILLYCDLPDNYEIPTPTSGASHTKDESALTKDHISNKAYDDNRSISSSRSYMIVPFKGKNPNMDAFLDQVKEEINIKGVNEVICEALEIKNEEEMFLESPQIIRVKKRKSKEQILALEEEFSKTQEWTKEFMNELAEKLKLDPAQVYKWHWDQICKKIGKTPKRKVRQQLKAAQGGEEKGVKRKR